VGAEANVAAAAAESHVRVETASHVEPVRLMENLIVDSMICFPRSSTSRVAVRRKCIVTVPHRRNLVPKGSPRQSAETRVDRRDVLRGLIHEYHRSAA